MSSSTTNSPHKSSMCFKTLYFSAHNNVEITIPVPSRRGRLGLFDFNNNKSFLTTISSVQSSVHPPPRRADSGAYALSFTSLSSIIWDVQWTQSSNWVGKLVASCAHLDNVHLSISPWKYFFYSSQRPLSAWCVLVYHQHYVSNLQVVFLIPPFLPSVQRC